MNILETISARKHIEVAERKKLCPVAQLEKRPLFSGKTVSLRGNLLQAGASGIIAEFKKSSPSRGPINSGAIVEEVTTGYVRAGASALSVLTDTDFFGGKDEDLVRARKVNECPLLRKDFIVDSYQVYEARSIGADAILLIASILSPEETYQLARLARSLGMETLLEVHGAEEMKHLNEHISVLGVNNRNLADFRVSIDISLSLSGLIPAGIVPISESGLNNPSDVKLLRQAGYKGFLIGELFMSAADPALACSNFISQLKQPEL